MCRSIAVIPLLLAQVMHLYGQAPLPPPSSQAPVRTTQFDPDPPFQGEAYRLIREIGAHARVYENLEALCDDIGGRPTGSPSLAKAQDWLKARLRETGVKHIQEEAYGLPSTWLRGNARAQLLTGNGQELRVAQIAWTPGTQGVLKAEVAEVGGKSIEELELSLAAARGKIALRGQTPLAPEGTPRLVFQKRLRALWESAEIKAILMSAKLPGNMVLTVGTPVKDSHQWTPRVPAAYLGQEHSNLLRRQLARGKRVELSLDLGGRIVAGPAQAVNIIAEIPGSARPDEIVILGAHLDSVDLASGATDNGAGVVNLLEVLRGILALNLRPARTLRFIFFTGEELEGLGSRAYVHDHAGELKNIQCVLVQDKGAGRILGWPTMGEEAWVPCLAEAMAPAYTIGCTQIIPGIITQSDHDAFFEVGVPAFFAYQESLDYWTVYHSDLDSFDHVVKENLVQGCQALAATAWGFAQMTRRVPHRSFVEDAANRAN